MYLPNRLQSRAKTFCSHSLLRFPLLRATDIEYARESMQQSCNYAFGELRLGQSIIAKVSTKKESGSTSICRGRRIGNPPICYGNERREDCFRRFISTAINARSFTISTTISFEAKNKSMRTHAKARSRELGSESVRVHFFSYGVVWASFRDK